MDLDSCSSSSPEKSRAPLIIYLMTFIFVHRCSQPLARIFSVSRTRGFLSGSTELCPPDAPERVPPLEWWTAFGGRLNPWQNREPLRRRPWDPKTPRVTDSRVYNKLLGVRGRFATIPPEGNKKRNFCFLGTRASSIWKEELIHSPGVFVQLDAWRR